MIVCGVAHADALAAIHAEAFDVAERWPASAFATLLGQPGMLGLLDPAGAFVLARRAADEAEVLTLATVPGARRQGRARTLLAEAHRRLTEVGAVVTFLEVASGNDAARGLYDALGYAAVGTRRGYYGGGDALIMRRAS